jgi:iron complex outermembrane recepter protein
LRSASRARALACALACSGAGGAALAQNPAEELETPSIRVIGVTPLPGFGVPAGQVPANVQAATGADAARGRALQLPEFLGARLPGVGIAETQGNPFQPDLLYRGFAASPLLGTPQGLSVYQDGVRVNEPFGDTVNWELLPMTAISTVNLIPGSNPLFGLNTLGGALSIRTKSGAQHPGTEARALGGSFGRREIEAQRGGASGDWDSYVSAGAVREDGWRTDSPSDVRHFFVKVGRQDGTSDVDVALTHAESELSGNGLLPRSLASADPRQAYTRGDTTRGRMTLLSVNATRWLTPDLLWSAVAYYRQSDRTSVNSDVNQVSDPRTGVVPYEDGDANASSVNRARLDQRGQGFSTHVAATSRRGNVLIAGGSYDRSRSAFAQSYQLGGFASDRSASPSGMQTDIVDLSGTSATASVYATDTYSPGGDWHATASARYNRTMLRTTDRLSPPLPAPARGLDNDIVYSRLNPALGVAWSPEARPGFYAGISEGNRPPSAIELGCSDRASPCNLPNAMASDPPLRQVVARTLEAGVRAREAETRWSATVFRTDSRDDILFVSSAASSGFFTNFGSTRRQGLEAAFERMRGREIWALTYGFVDATYRSGATVFSTANAGADANGDIVVSAGNRIPGIPRHRFNALAGWGVTERLGATANVVAASRQLARGNDNNQDPGGAIAGYALLNLGLDWRLEKGWRLFAKITNVFDRRYATAAAQRQNFFPGGALAAPGAQTDETFVAPGAPRGIWVGIELVADRPTK